MAWLKLELIALALSLAERRSQAAIATPVMIAASESKQQGYLYRFIAVYRRTGQ